MNRRDKQKVFEPMLKYFETEDMKYQMKIFQYTNL